MGSDHARTSAFWLRTCRHLSNDAEPGRSWLTTGMAIKSGHSGHVTTPLASFHPINSICATLTFGYRSLPRMLMDYDSRCRNPNLAVVTRP